MKMIMKKRADYSPVP